MDLSDTGKVPIKVGLLLYDLFDNVRQVLVYRHLVRISGEQGLSRT